MRTAVTLGRKHGSKTLEVLTGPDVPVTAQREAFKAFQRNPTHSTLEHVELWESDEGRVKERRLAKPTAVTQPAEQKPKTSKPKS